ncbi:hypothetical protein [Nannocystis pusilla]|uniref:hypothetical protein n=1 Tax=Nannocystis pusilla TaxID=889268 RepID=UPI003B766478
MRPGNLGAIVCVRLVGPATAVTDRVEVRSASTAELPPDEAALPSDGLQQAIALSGEWSVPLLLEPRDALAVYHTGLAGTSGLQVLVTELDTGALLAWVAAKATLPPLADAVPSQIDVGDLAVIGVSTKAARADHQHALPEPGVPAAVSKSAASAGASSAVARADHKHDVTTASPVAAAGTNSSEGVASTLARSDHVHRTEIEVRQAGVAAGSRPRLNFDGAVTVADNGPGDRVDVTVTAAVVTASSPSQIDVGDAASTGVSTEAARADHQHALPAPAAPANVTKAAASAGPARPSHAPITSTT